MPGVNTGVHFSDYGICGKFLDPYLFFVSLTILHLFFSKTLMRSSIKKKQFFANYFVLTLRYRHENIHGEKHTP